MFDPNQFSLPIASILPETKQLLAQENTLLVNAPPGAGKSTLLPLALLNEPWLQGKKILMLEPRRLAAKTIAYRMSDMLQSPLGKTIGYRVRLENVVSDQTQLEVITEGILTKMLLSNNALDEVGLVIFDEFHERSIHADVALALCREVQQILRPDLRILVMSATLDMPKLQEMLCAPVVKSDGKLFSVKIHYTGQNDLMLLPETLSRVLVQAVKENPGDALAFLPGEAEIRKCEEILLKQLPDFKIHPLYGTLSQAEQMAAIWPNKHGKRKIILATSIAETSLTIEGVKIVVDSGFSRISRFDPKSGLSRLETVMVSKDAADQRAGRAGRLAPGICYRMWTTATQDRLPEHRLPEILETDLTSVCLDLFAWGTKDINQLLWLTPPPAGALNLAIDTLEQLNAIENKSITSHGKQLQAMACHPRMAHMLLLAGDTPSKQLACDIAALLDERDPLGKEAGIDLSLRVEALRRYRTTKSGGSRLARIAKLASYYRSLLKVDEDNSPIDKYEVGLLLAYAYPERIACARNGNNAQFQLANGKIGAAGHKDDLAHESWLSVAHMDTRDGLGKIFLAAPLNPKDLLPMVKEKETIVWDSRKGGLIASKDLRIGSIVLQSKPLKEPSKDLVLQALLEAIRKEGESLLNLEDGFEQLIYRMASLAVWNADDSWPKHTVFSLLQDASWLAPFLDNIKKPEDFKKINLKEALMSSLSWEAQQALENLCPEKIKVPTGSNLSIQYFANAETPVLAVRLQEVFGLSDTPTINNGKTKLVLHLLSPGYKPVQVTTDLHSFWNNTYHEVKKELKRRYPKHAWPDDPWNAEPVRKGKSER
jgi:ATP-dependent helicase HrpB